MGRTPRSDSAVVSTVAVTAAPPRLPTPMICATPCGARRRHRRCSDHTDDAAGGGAMTLSIGAQAPDFSPPDSSRPDTGGASWSAGDGDDARATVLVFTCNHCPYALAWHDRIAQVARDYTDRGVRVLAINPNDADRYPRASLE